MPAETPAALGAPDTWVAPLARAIPALVLGLVITFSADHSSLFGLIGFGIFGVVTAAVQLASALRADRAIRGIAVLQGIVTGLAGIAALVVPTGGVGYLVIVVSAWAIIAGALELVNGLRFRRARIAARDWLLTGALTVLLGIVFLLVPQGFAQHYSFDDKNTTVSGTLTDAIILVGILGAWAIIVGVQLAIATLTLRPQRTAAVKAAEA